MKIIAISTNNYFNNNKFKYSNTSFKFGLSSDIISFHSKKYDSQSITNPTNHCAYCGCKVYNENQIESIAREMLSLKSERLQGKIRSIIEKLNGAKYSDEIALAKRMENHDEINFFKNFLDLSLKKSFLKGEAIFQQHYSQSPDEAFVTLTKNMHPLLRTIDHVSPQNKKEKNNNIDLNLVEACYCCNHNLKKGIPFDEFYSMFPSIQHNMPADKLNYARSNILENGQSAINQRLSVSNIIKSLNRLFLQRQETVNYLNSINYRIECLKKQVDEEIKNINSIISSKQSEIDVLKEELADYYNNNEFIIANEYEQLQVSLSDLNNSLAHLQEKYNNLSETIFQLNNNKLKNKNNHKVDELKRIQVNLSKSIKSQEKKRLEIEEKIQKLKSEIKISDNINEKKQNYIKLTKKIQLLENEIQILEQTIHDLEAQKNK